MQRINLQSTTVFGRLKSIFSSGWQCTTSRMLLLPPYNRNRHRCSMFRTNTNCIPEKRKKQYLGVWSFSFPVKSILFLLMYDKKKKNIISVDYLEKSAWDPSASFMLIIRIYLLKSKCSWKQKCAMREFGLPPRCECHLSSFGILRDVEW
jgi:hypothetical protein